MLSAHPVYQALVALGFLIMAVGLVLALVADGGEIELHATLGIVAMVLGLINPINGLLRPGKEPHEAKKRKVWEVGHRLVRTHAPAAQQQLTRLAMPKLREGGVATENGAWTMDNSLSLASYA